MRAPIRVAVLAASLVVTVGASGFVLGAPSGAPPLTDGSSTQPS